MVRRFALVGLLLSAGLSLRADAPAPSTLFRHAIFGIEFYSLDTNRPIYTLNADKLFVPGSTTKLVTMGSALGLLGAGYRFHTRVYKTGELGATACSTAIWCSWRAAIRTSRVASASATPSRSRTSITPTAAPRATGWRAIR